MSEESIVLFHDKSKIERFFLDFPQLQNHFYVESGGKYFVPSILCNSPRDITHEAMIILRNADFLQNYTVKHMKSSKLGEDFKVHHFAFLDDKPLNWASQLLHDLRNFYLHDGLELIGACNDVAQETKVGLVGKSFYLLFYRQPKYHKEVEFEFFVEIVYEDMQQKELQDFINRKSIEEGGLYRTCLTVYERS